jgi:predicted O-methyltransferase YrrM
MAEHGNEFKETEKRASRYNWETTNFNEGAKFLFSLTSFLQPKTIIELGTFEAHATMLFFQATRLNKARIITIDCDTSIPIKHTDYKLVAKSRSSRIAKANAAGGNIMFIPGDTRQVLKKVLPSLKKVDFVFQDSMHFVPGLLEEFDLVRPYLSPSGVIIFDDWWMVKLKYRFLFPYLIQRFTPRPNDPFRGPLDTKFTWAEVNRGKGFLIGQRIG